MFGEKLLMALFALLIVGSLILLLGMLLKKLETAEFRPFSKTEKPQKQKRIQILESKIIDPKRKLVLVQVDQQEHLLLLSPTHEQVISTISAQDQP